MPIAIEIDGANRHDMKLVERTLDQLMVERPEPSADRPQHLCMDKGYDNDSVRDLIARSGFVAHMKSRGQEAADKHHNGAKAPPLGSRTYA